MERRGGMESELIVAFAIMMIMQIGDALVFINVHAEGTGTTLLKVQVRSAVIVCEMTATKVGG
jgi:hypothetical protein